jgi:GntR family transcriptional regulator, phosphonate transport system regulatory protein
MTTTSIFTMGQRASGITAWKQIADVLADEIRNRTYAQTGRLPAEHALAERFGVHRHTLRQAMTELQRLGLVRVEQGRGTFVQHERLDYPLSRRTRFSDNLAQRGLLPSKQLIAARAEAPTSAAAQALGLAIGSRVVVIEMLDEADGQPIGLMNASYPADRFGGLIDLLSASDAGTSTSELLRRFGVTD